jgi:hypothetical protein
MHRLFALQRENQIPPANLFPIQLSAQAHMSNGYVLPTKNTFAREKPIFPANAFLIQNSQDGAQVKHPE